MKPKILSGLAALAVTAAGSVAAEITGGDLTLSYSQFLSDIESSDGGDTASKLSLGGSAEFALQRNFSLQADLMQAQVGLIDDTATMAGLHGVYRLGEVTSLGAFAARDSVSGADFTYAGLEAKRVFPTFDAEGYVARVGGDAEGATLFGVSGQYRMLPNLDLGVSLDRLDGDENTALTRIAAQAGYHLIWGARIGAEIGAAEVGVADIEDTEGFVGLSFSYAFGAERGASFERRGLLDLLPGL